MIRLSVVAVSITLLIGTAAALSQSYPAPTQPARTTAAAAVRPSLSANLVDAAAKAASQAAIVKVKITGVTIIDPADVNEKPETGQGHLHYQIDNGAVIATTVTKLSFHGLAKGPHRITVMLAGNDHKPLGPQQVLSVNIP